MNLTPIILVAWLSAAGADAVTTHLGLHAGAQVHRCVHAGLIRIDGNADVHLDFHGAADLLRFGL